MADPGKNVGVANPGSGVFLGPGSGIRDGPIIMIRIRGGDFGPYF